MLFFFSLSGDHRDRHVLTHSFPTRRSSDLECSRGHARQRDVGEQRLARDIGGRHHGFDNALDRAFSRQTFENDRLADAKPLGVARINEKLGVEVGSSEERRVRKWVLLTVALVGRRIFTQINLHTTKFHMYIYIMFVSY